MWAILPAAVLVHANKDAARLAPNVFYQRKELVLIKLLLILDYILMTSGQAALLMSSRVLISAHSKNKDVVLIRMLAACGQRRDSAA